VNIAEEAIGIVYGDREETYGDPSKNFRTIAQLWSGIFGVEVGIKQVALAMIALKMSRELNAHKRDNLVDIIGYALAYQRCLDHEETISVTPRKRSGEVVTE
jgi:hypothetical protein